MQYIKTRFATSCVLLLIDDNIWIKCPLNVKSVIISTDFIDYCSCFIDVEIGAKKITN